jgi:hypothetical protein
VNVSCSLCLHRRTISTAVRAGVFSLAIIVAPLAATAQDGPSGHEEEVRYSECTLKQVFSRAGAKGAADQRVSESEAACSEEWQEVVEAAHRRVAPTGDPIVWSDQHRWADEFLAQRREWDRAWYVDVLRGLDSSLDERRRRDGTLTIPHDGPKARIPTVAECVALRRAAVLAANCASWRPGATGRSNLWQT